MQTEQPGNTPNIPLAMKLAQGADALDRLPPRKRRRSPRKKPDGSPTVSLKEGLTFTAFPNRKRLTFAIGFVEDKIHISKLEKQARATLRKKLGFFAHLDNGCFLILLNPTKTRVAIIISIAMLLFINEQYPKIADLIEQLLSMSN